MVYSPRHQEERRTAGRMLLWLVAACVCVPGLTVPWVYGQGAPQRFLLSSSQVVNAMADRQLPTRGVQVRIGAPITAGIANPKLEVQAIALLSSHEMRLRMTCRDHSQCLSFFATATYPEELNPAALNIKPENEAAGTVQPAPTAKPLKEVRGSPLSPAGPPASGAPVVVQSGSPATLELDGQRVHIRVEVICLQKGAAGDKIRVTTRDHKNAYVAEIVTPILLKGTF